VVVSLCQSAGGGRSVGNDESCPVLKVAPVGKKSEGGAGDGEETCLLRKEVEAGD